MVKTVCPSCFFDTMEVKLGYREICFCSRCGFKMSPEKFLSSLIPAALGISVYESSNGDYYVQNSEFIRLARIHCDDGGVVSVIDVTNLDLVLPLVTKLADRDNWPKLSLRVEFGLSKDLEECPICGSPLFVESEEFGVPKVACDSCKRFVVAFDTYVLSRASFGPHPQTVNRYGNTVVVHKTVVAPRKTMKEIWKAANSLEDFISGYVDYRLGKSTPELVEIVRMELRELNTEPKKYILAVELPRNNDSPTTRSNFFDSIEYRLKPLKSLKVLWVEKVL